jgi:hypothetical protein
MSIIILTPAPKQTDSSTGVSPLATAPTLATRLTSEILHLVGLEGHRFETFEQLRDFAEAQIAAAAAVVDAPIAAVAPVTADPAAPQP